MNATLSRSATIALLALLNGPRARELYARWRADDLSEDEWDEAERIAEAVRADDASGRRPESAGAMPSYSELMDESPAQPAAEPARRPAEPTPRQSRTFRTAKGVLVETTLTNEEALAICAKGRQDFGRSLAARHHQYGRLSNDQWAWVHKLALEAK
jgi:hypothetical protein